MKKTIQSLQQAFRQKSVVRGAVIAAATAVLGLASMEASAFAVPTNNAALAFDFYDIVVTQGLKGPIGFTIGVLFIGFGATKVLTQWPIALFAVLAGTMLVKADTILTSLGAMV